MMFKYLALLLLAGCTIIPKAPTTPISIFDFGPISQLESIQPASSPIRIQIAEIAAPVWLDTQAMRYRLAYHHPAQTHVYAHSRWVATPAKLLTERIRQHVTSWQNRSDRNNNDFGSATYSLKIELEEFMQGFETVDRSHTIVSLRASLIKQNTYQLVAQQRFSETKITSSADASGAVENFIVISDQLAAELIQWSTKMADRQPLISK